MLQSDLTFKGEKALFISLGCLGGDVIRISIVLLTYWFTFLENVLYSFKYKLKIMY